MAGPIVVLGVFNADTAYRAARLPQPGETVMGSGFALGPGGKGSNQAVAAARAGKGVAVHLVTRLGRDGFAAMARAVWAEAGVLAEVTEDASSHTGAALVLLDEATGENAIIVVAGAGGRISVADVAARAGLIGSAAVFLVQLEQPLPAAMEGLRLARAAGVCTVLNPAPAADLPQGMLALCDVLTPNATEARALSGVAVDDPRSARVAAERLCAAGAGSVVVTLGARGAVWHGIWRGGEVALYQPALVAGPVVDTTGAGDAFNGGLAVALGEGQGPPAALRFAAAAAGLAVTRAGAATAMPSRVEIEALLDAAR